MRVKVDEDLPFAALEMLRSRGYEASNVLEQEMSGWKDPDLWSVVQSEQRFLVTADKGFADVRIYPPGSHSGVLLLRPNQDGIRPMIELLEQVLANYDLEALRATVTVVTARGIRVRRS